MCASQDAPWRNEELLRQKYVVQRQQPKEIIEEFGCSRATLYKWINEFGLKEERKKPWRDKDTLEELYVDERMTITEIADELDTNRSSVHYYLKKHNIERRNLAGRDKDAPWKDKDNLKEWYYGQGLSTYEIAEKFDDVSPSGVVRQMKRMGLSLRKNNREKLPAPHLNENGYERVETKHNGERNYVFIHHLVAIAEGADPYKVFGDLTHVVHHKNEIEWDNRPENLELISQSKHRQIHGNQHTD